MATDIKCLVVRQPWAWAIVMGAKDIENRPREMDYRGPVVIQAGSTRKEVNRFLLPGMPSLPKVKFAYGALIGVVDLIDITPMEKSLEANPWAWGPYCWKLGNARRFKQVIPARGKANLYSLPPELSKPVSAAIDSADVVNCDNKANLWIELFKAFFREDTRRHDSLVSYLSLNDLGNALRLAERAVSLWGTADDYANRAIVRMMNSQNNPALEDINKAIKIDSQNARFYQVRSLIYNDLEMGEWASRDLVKARQLDPQDCKQVGSSGDKGPEWGREYEAQV